MARRVSLAIAPARERAGLPVVPDGSRRHPLLLRLPDSDATQPDIGSCNNGCETCLTLPVAANGAVSAGTVRGQHVVIRHREATLRKDLPSFVQGLALQAPASISLLTNGRMLGYGAFTRALIRAGVGRFIVKLFGLDAVSHDAHTRTPKSFDQALAGIRVAKDLGAEVHVTFPNRSLDKDLRQVLARELSGCDPVEMPEPEVEAHANEYRYDVVVLQEGIELGHPHWHNSFFPMAHVNTGPVCNIRCVYCNVHGGTDQRVYDRDYIKQLIDDAAERVLIKRGGAGIPTLDFIGGEPTLHQNLAELISYGRERGFSKVYICTNGALLGKNNLLDRLVAAGLTGVRFSFHDHRTDVANALANMPGLGESYLTVAKLLLSRPDVRTHIFRIILANTIDALPDYVRWLAANNKTGRPIDLAFGMPSMRGRLFENREIYPQLAGLREAVSAAVELAISLGIEPMIHHAPACLHPESPGRAACTHIKTMQFDALSGVETDTNFEGDARHGAACANCSARTRGCAGLPSAYFDQDPEAAEAWLTPVQV